MKMVVHHFPRDRLRDIFQGFYNQLKDNGIILIERASGNKVSPKLFITLQTV